MCNKCILLDSVAPKTKKNILDVLDKHTSEVYRYVNRCATAHTGALQVRAKTAGKGNFHGL